MELSPVFARRLYLALLVESLERPNVPKLIEKTGWPRPSYYPRCHQSHAGYRY